MICYPFYRSGTNEPAFSTAVFPLQLAGLMLLLSQSLAAQKFELPKQSLKEATVGTAGKEWVADMTANWKGQLTAIGGASTGKYGGSDIYLTTYNDQLNKGIERYIGRSADDNAHCIVPDHDGLLLVAGYSTTPRGHKNLKVQYYGGRDGWLLWLDETGEVVNEWVMGNDDDDEFIFVRPLNGGGYLLVGNSGTATWILRLNAQKKLLWQKHIRYHNLPTKASAAILTADQQIYVVGEVIEQNAPHLWLGGFDLDGKPILETILPFGKARDGLDIIELNDRSLGVIGRVGFGDRQGREDAYFCSFARNGVMGDYAVLGDRDADALYSLIQTTNGAILAGGRTRSDERGSRRDASWLVNVGRNGKVIGDETYGSKFSDQIHALYQHPDGRVFAAGFSAHNVLKSRQAWMMQMSKSAKPPAKTPKTPRISLGQVKYPTNLNFLKSGERTSIPLILENTDSSTLGNLRAVIKTVQGPGGDGALVIGEQTCLPILPALQRTAFFLPFQLYKEVPGGMWRFSVELFHFDKPLGVAQYFDVQVEAPAVAQMSLEAQSPANTLTMAEVTQLPVTVRNTGNTRIKSIILNVSPIPGLKLPAPIRVGDLDAGESFKYNIPVEVTADALGGPMVLRLRASDESLQRSAAREVHFTVAPPAKKIAVDSSKNYVVSVWVSPNPDNFERQEIVWSSNEITVQVKIVSNQPVDRQNFCLEINGQPCVQGVKFDEVKIKGERLSKTFQQTVPLSEGVNKLRAVVNNSAGRHESETMQIVYSPSKPNLHIIAIGVPGGGLKYTTEDARDFAAAMGLNNKAFQNIFIDTLVTEAKTTKTEILKALRRLQYRHDDLQINPKDLLLFFVSSHGFNTGSGFRIAASDYDSPFQEETSLDFEKDLLSYLKPIKCQKMLFFDACHSGAAFSALPDDGLAGLAAQQRDLTMILSSQANEFSYEDEAWGHGAFTGALLRALKAFITPINRNTVDKNADNKLEINELYGYMSREIPMLVNKKNPKTRTEQHPNLVLANQGAAETVLFELK
jgi:Caspase domain